MMLPSLFPIRANLLLPRRQRFGMLPNSPNLLLKHRKPLKCACAAYFCAVIRPGTVPRSLVFCSSCSPRHLNILSTRIYLPICITPDNILSPSLLLRPSFDFVIWHKTRSLVDYLRLGRFQFSTPIDNLLLSHSDCVVCHSELLLALCALSSTCALKPGFCFLPSFL
jgi:hypothetical protein